jgi:hypothetical protein
MRIIMYVPDAKNSRGAVFSFAFHGLLTFRFETLGIGELDGEIEIAAAYFMKGDEWKRWNDRMRLLCEDDSFGYRSIEEPGDIYHVVFETFAFGSIDRGTRKNDIELVCRRIESEDVSEEWDVKSIPRPYRIPGPPKKRRTKAKES